MIDLKKGPLRVGFDFGGVFVRSRRGISDVRSNPDYSWKALDRAFFGSIKESGEIVVMVGPLQAYFIKRCENKDEERYFHYWLEKKRFYQRTRFERGNVLVCRSREKKVSFCIAHGINVMVDDRYEVFDWIQRSLFGRSLIKCVCFKPDLEEKARFPNLHGFVKDVHSWRELREELKTIAANMGYDINSPYPLPRAPGQVRSYVADEFNKLLKEE